MPWHAPCEELPHDDAEGVDVRRVGVPSPGQDFWGEPAWVAGCHAAEHDGLLHDSRQVEIAHLHPPVLVHKQVRGLEVSVDDGRVAGVQIHHALCRVQAHVQPASHPSEWARLNACRACTLQAWK